MFSSTFQNSLAKGSTVLWHKTAAKRPDEIHCPHGENRSHVNNLSTSTWHRHSQVVTIHTLKYFQLFPNASSPSFQTLFLFLCDRLIHTQHSYQHPKASAQPAFLAGTSCCDMYTVPWKLASLSTVASKRKEAQGGISVSSQHTMPMSAPILRCSDHHLFHFGRGDRERDGEGGFVGSELSPHAFLFASIRNSGSFTSSSLSLTQWRARKRFQMLRKSKWNVLNIILNTVR